MTACHAIKKKSRIVAALAALAAPKAGGSDVPVAIALAAPIE